MTPQVYKKLMLLQFVVMRASKCGWGGQVVDGKCGSLEHVVMQKAVLLARLLSTDGL